ncbi:MAG: hypothetical protein HXY28_09405 [Hydrogenophilaceae bacterium]|jgi:hypothetical protein|nr:hypothetical protein [Hydrogenophilaceae bacterium]
MIRWAVLAVAAVLCGPPAAAQARLFTADSELQITIAAPFAELVRRAPRSTDPFPATLTHQPASGAAQTYQIALSPRGLTRRTRGFCTFPPLRVEFQSPRRGAVFAGQSRLKLVVHCRPSARHAELVVLEYLAYRLYNEITPLSFRVRPARVTYRDTSGRRREETQFAFFIEDVDRMAQRNGRIELEVAPRTVTVEQLDPAAAADFALFQFMIGNLDWDMRAGPEGEECCHNSKLIARARAPRSAVVPTPYDFDHSGFVAAPYAQPPPEIPVANVRQRWYRGYCRHNDALSAAAERFRARRSAMLALIDGETRLSAARRATARRYIESFFAILDDPDAFRRQILGRCRG